MVNISVKNLKIDHIDDGLLIMCISENGQNKSYLKKYSTTPNILNTIEKIGKEQLDQIGKFGKNMVLFSQQEDKMYKILLLGVGNLDDLDGDKIRRLGGIVSLKAKELNFHKMVIPNFFDSNSNLEYLVEGLILSLYEFNKYKQSSDNKESSPSYYDSCSIDILVEGETDEIQATINKIINISYGVFYARDLSNSPPNSINPSELANSAISLKGDKITVKIFDYDQLKNNGLNGIISVGKGSENEPNLIAIEYKNSKSDDKPILLVGKAVTFDTGGISIKPSEKMDEMKFDKSGGCTVLGIMKALSLLNLPLNVVALIPSVENMPSGSAYRPGDIIKMYNGKTVEVLNTDAEGRLILADALSYGVSKYSPKFVIDFATLTGACIIALGTNIAGIMGNDNKLINEIISFSNLTGEKMWQLPLTEEFYELIKSRVAEIKNIGGRTGGAITAAAFLGHFVDNTPWAHIDIAGTAWTQDGTMDKSYNPKGSTGFGVRTIIKFLENHSS